MIKNTCRRVILISMLLTIYLTAHAQSSSYIITFTSTTAKQLCVQNWDTNGDGELSEAEAAAVTDLGTVFTGNTRMVSFNELQYFTGLKSIGSRAFQGCSSLTTVTIPNSATSIGFNAFDGCKGLTSVFIPNSVTSIDNGAFLGCSSLTTITIPNSVTSIEHGAFRDCSGLTSVTIPNSVRGIGDYAFFGCIGLTSLTIGNSVTTIGDYTFYDCKGLTSVTIPNSVTSIGNGAFFGCSSLTTITIPKSVTSIGNGAFSVCSGLTSIKVESGNSKYDSRNNCNAIIETSTNTLITGCNNTVIPNSVTSIGDSAFSSCSGLTSVTIPNSVTSIERNAFAFCSGLTSVSIPNSVTSIGNDAFRYCSGLTSVSIPNSVTTIETQTFFGCSGLTSVNIPNSVTSIGRNAFAYCSGLTSVNIPNSVRRIEEYTFQYCSGLTSVNIPNSVTSIGRNAFAYCSGLTSVTIPNSVTTIGAYSFGNCSCLKEIFSLIKNPASVILTGDAFLGISQDNVLKVPKGTLEAYKSSKRWTSFFTNIVETDFGTSVEANSYTIEYGDELPSFAYTVSGSSSSGEPTLTCQAKKGSPAGVYDIIIAKGTLESEGELTLVNGTLTIRKATLTASPGNYTKKQGDAMPVFSISYSGFKNGETKSVLTQEPVVTCNATASSAPGSYPITLSGGEAQNYEFNYQNGTLTVIAADAAAVTARSYTINYGDPLPKFEYETTGATLSGTPTVSCAATSNSDVGTYDIVVSKGSVSNYNVSYINGTLTINKAVLTASAGNYSRPQGFENPVFSVTYEGFKNNEDQSVLDTEPAIKCDATKDSPIGEYPVTLSGGTARNYSFKYINGMLIIADYLDINNVSYSIKSNSERTMTVGMKDYQGHVTIPASVELNGLQYKVVGIETSAFAGCDGLVSVTLPNTLQKESVGRILFSVCKNLAAIKWEASFPMTEVMLGGVNNPNLLFYTKNAAYAPSSVKNVVVNGTAEEITLTDAEGSNNFYCPTEFTARKISYTHNYKMTSGFGGKPQGWETIALPFDVKEIRHSSKGTVLPFAAWNNSSSAKPFWLYSLSAGGFSRASSIQANTPYIICMPNNEEYDTDYILSGAVTFSATDVKVKVSSAISSGKSGTKTFIPAFCAQEKSGGVYALNVNNDIHSERGGYDEGSRFVSNLRTVSPFEAYMTDSSAGAKQTIDIEFSDATGIDELTENSENGAAVYTIMGQKVRGERLKNGTLPQGIYIKNGRKVSVK